MVKVLRWLLTPVAAALWVGGIVVAGRWVVSLADARCASGNMVGGACVEPWHTGVVEGVIYVGLILGAAGLVTLPALIAPALKRSMATLGFLLGAGLVGTLYFMTRWSDFQMPLLVVLVSGGISVWWMWTRGERNAVR